MPTQYIEALAYLKPNVNTDEVMNILKGRGFSATRMPTPAVLISGDGSLFATNFGISEDTAAQPGGAISINVPVELRSHIASISIPALRSTH